MYSGVLELLEDLVHLGVLADHQLGLERGVVEPPRGVLPVRVLRACLHRVPGLRLRVAFDEARGVRLDNVGQADRVDPLGPPPPGPLVR